MNCGLRRRTTLQALLSSTLPSGVMPAPPSNKKPRTSTFTGFHKPRRREVEAAQAGAAAERVARAAAEVALAEARVLLQNADVCLQESLANGPKAALAALVEDGSVRGSRGGDAHAEGQAEEGAVTAESRAG